MDPNMKYVALSLVTYMIGIHFYWSWVAEKRNKKFIAVKIEVLQLIEHLKVFFYNGIEYIQFSSWMQWHLENLMWCFSISV